jgi:hypothetical protein
MFYPDMCVILDKNWWNLENVRNIKGGSVAIVHGFCN